MVFQVTCEFTMVSSAVCAVHLQFTEECDGLLLFHFKVFLCPEIFL